MNNMKQLALINPENVTEQEAAVYRVRQATRAIVFDKDNFVALLHATKYNYYKLPGGGVEEGEDHITALKRECLEEIGCDIEVVEELGTVLEYRKMYGLRQTSYCYLARLVGNKGTPQLMQDEMEEGFQTVWLPIKDALKKVGDSSVEKYEAQFMTARDVAFLKAVK